MTYLRNCGNSKTFYFTDLNKTRLLTSYQMQILQYQLTHVLLHGWMSINCDFICWSMSQFEQGIH